MWRGVSEAEPFGSGRTMIMAGSNRSEKFVAYPIRGRDGRRLVNWVAEVRLAPDDAAAGAHDWTRTSDPAAVLEHFARWSFDWLDVPALIAGTASIFEYPMIDRDPLAYWGAGRVTLLGDAAHPMYPIGSNGASQAIIDARVLARELAQPRRSGRRARRLRGRPPPADERDRARQPPPRPRAGHDDRRRSARRTASRTSTTSSRPTSCARSSRATAAPRASTSRSSTRGRRWRPPRSRAEHAARRGGLMLDGWTTTPSRCW